jgi:hypothetical protein
MSARSSIILRQHTDTMLSSSQNRALTVRVKTRHRADWRGDRQDRKKGRLKAWCAPSNVSALTWANCEMDLRGSANRSLSHIEPVSGTPKRKQTLNWAECQVFDLQNHMLHKEERFRNDIGTLRLIGAALSCFLPLASAPVGESPLAISNNPLNRSGAKAVYRTVEAIDRCPRSCWIARVS